MGSSSMHGRGDFPVLLVAPFVIFFFDSLFNYFLRGTSAPLPVNFLVPIFFIPLLMKYGVSVLPLRSGFTWWMLAISFSFMLGLLTAPGVDELRVNQALGMFVAYISGYLAFRWVEDVDTVARLLISVVGAYVCVCLVALLKIAPGYFPLEVEYWSLNGIPQARPAVTTNQNFQVFYLFPCAILLALPFKALRFTIVAALVMGSLYILSQLQTRSGLITFGGGVLLALMSPLWTRELGCRKLIWLAIAGACGTLMVAPLIVELASLVLYRFTQDNYATGLGRLVGFLYLFEHLLDPAWWLPQGSHEIIARTGDFAHSNITSMFLNGGIIGLAGWLVVVVYPIFRLTLMFLRRQLDATATLVWCALIVVWVTQMTLDVAVQKYVWIWAGAGVGVLDRCLKRIQLEQHERERARVRRVNEKLTGLMR